MRVSVAMATFNGARFLPDQLLSLERQEVTPYELVVRDDGSEDESVTIVNEFSRTAPFPVRVHRNEQRRGFADTFISASAACTGDAVAFCDQDDVWLPQKLARCAAALQRDDVLLAMHTSLLVDESLGRSGKAFPEVRADRTEPPLGGDPWLAVRGMSMVFSSALTPLAGGPRPRSHYSETALNHDEWIYMLARALGSVAYIAEPLALYRIHGANVTGDRGGVLRRVIETGSTGAAYYARRRDQARDLAELFRGVAEPWAENAGRAAASYDALAERLTRRLEVYGSGSRRTRLAALLRARRTGVYGDRSNGGFGARGLARDVAMIASGRS